MAQNNAHGHEFGPYRLDLGQRVLTRAGEKVVLTPKATEILALLVINAGQLIEKDALVNQIWRDTFVEKSNLTQNVFLLRRALGDERPAPKYIQTVARRGYRFVASVRPIGEDGRATNGEQGENTPRTVAVLPFINAISKFDEAATVIGPAERLLRVRYDLECSGTLKLWPLIDHDTLDRLTLYSRTALYESYAIGDHRTTATAENNYGLFLWVLESGMRPNNIYCVLGDSLRR